VDGRLVVGREDGRGSLAAGRVEQLARGSVGRVGPVPADADQVRVDVDPGGLERLPVAELAQACRLEVGPAAEVRDAAVAEREEVLDRLARAGRSPASRAR
jgi:hypothetical protein